MMNVRLMLTATIAAALLTLGGCSRVQSDWKAAQAADTIEAYGDFLHKHPDATESTEARARMEQLGEDRDWQRASTSDTREAYAQFIALHPNSKWTQEARIRIENFALGPTPSTTAPVTTLAAAAAAPAAAALAKPKAPEVAPSNPAVAKKVVAEKPQPAAARVLAQAAPSQAAGKPRQAIQLGAFNSEAIALAQWRKLVARHPELAGLKLQIETTVRAGRTLYRLRTAVADEAAATRTCAALQHGGDACLVVTSSR